MAVMVSLSILKPMLVTKLGAPRLCRISEVRQPGFGTSPRTWEPAERSSRERAVRFSCMFAVVDKPDRPAEEFKWLPEALESVALRLARADECAFKIGDMASKWSLEGPLDIEQVRRGTEVQTFLKSLRPVPPEASLLFSEAVNHLRASIDNVVWHLVEEAHGQLTGYVAKQIAMPITDSQTSLDRWAAPKVAKGVTAFGSGATLGRRLWLLQPYVDVNSEVPSIGATLARMTGVEVESAHPLKLLQAYSNADKHRSVRLTSARTFSSTDAQPLADQNLAHQELRVGDAMGPPTPWGQLAILETNTAVMVQRPAPFSAWVNPVKELNAMRQHVSDVVIPVLLTGLQMSKGLPPTIEFGDNGLSNRERLVAGEWDDAEARLADILQARFQEALTQDVRFAPVVEDAGLGATDSTAANPKGAEERTVAGGPRGA